MFLRLVVLILPNLAFLLAIPLVRRAQMMDPKMDVGMRPVGDPSSTLFSVEDLREKRVVPISSIPPSAVLAICDDLLAALVRLACAVLAGTHALTLARA